MPIGTLMRNTSRHPIPHRLASTSAPARIGAARIERPITGPKAPKTLVISSSSKTSLSIPNPWGIISAPNEPCSTRKAISTPGEGATRAGRGHHREASGADQEQTAAAEHVAQPGAGDQEHGERERVAGGQPLQGGGAAAERGPDRRAGDVDDRRVHEIHDVGGDHDREHEPAQRVAGGQLGGQRLRPFAGTIVLTSTPVAIVLLTEYAVRSYHGSRLSTLFAMSSSHGVIWDRPERAARGPAPSLSREEITAAAVAMADTQGIEAVSMRTLAVQLGVGAASLYRYVDRKDELIDLMVDAVMGDDLQFEIRGDWRSVLRSFARGLRAMTLRHPWVAVHGAGRRNLGPNTAWRYEQVLGAIDGLGLDIDEMLVMVETLDAFIRGHALDELSEQESARRSGLDQEQWMQVQTPYVESLINSGHYPLLTRVVLDARSPHDPDRLEHSFDLGLERVLDGLATMIPPADHPSAASTPLNPPS